MAETILDAITKRRSVRAFTGDAVDREQLVASLKAAMAAPSARNSKPWSFLVITDPAHVRQVCLAHPYAKFGDKAGAVILPFGRKEGYRWFDQDMGAATENLLVALANLGLGATWCGMPDELQEAVRAIAPIPEDLFFFALIPVGVPADDIAPRTQYEETRVHWERYQAAS